MADDESLYGSLQARPSGWNYFELDDILACQEKMPCTFETQVMDLGFLDHGSDNDHIEPATKMDLPFWLAKELCARRRMIISVELPKVYREAYRQILEADAMAVDLNKLGPYFYDVGGKLLEFGNAENPRIAESLMMVCIILHVVFLVPPSLREALQKQNHPHCLTSPVNDVFRHT
jgi:GINS complex subunit 3